MLSYLSRLLGVVRTVSGNPGLLRAELTFVGFNVDPSLVGRFNDFGELQALAPEARQRLRYVMLTHANDAVGHFGLDLLVRAPAWLGPAEGRAATVPGAQQWPSPTSFVRPWST